ncbi:MAG: elongation factor Ts [Crocinitomicaceae bacterium]|jgi:elongation factor Ts|nr:elongation factor Ts [Crocinitomicaceae bacterium]MBT6515797.1 elongation factor Ts [Crocinitomicaceae bacterium]
MSTITASLVNELRKKTGAGMMDCKNALVEANGDMEVAVDLLRKKGQKVAAKRGDRDASEGLVIAKTTADGKLGVLLCLNCETDFVAKNEDFGQFANKLADIAIANNANSVDDLKSKSYDGNGLSVADKITEQTGVIGEKIDISACQSIEAANVVAYNHPGNQIATLVGFTKEAQEAGRQVAMQVAAMAPISVDESSVPADVIEKELEIGKELAIQEGKPADLAEKIAHGRLKKFYKESTLLNQAFVRDNKKSVKQFLQETDGELTVTDFKRLSLSI